MTCKNCFHNNVCEARAKLGDITADVKVCKSFIDSSRVIVPPCKVGDKIYMPWEWYGAIGIAILTIERIVVDFTRHSYVNTDFFSDDEEYWVACNCGRFEFDDFGKIVFLTREEAEAALKGRGKNNG